MHDSSLTKLLEAAAGSHHGLMASPRTLMVVLVGCGLLSGCQKSPTILDNSNLVVQPGRGISNLCEVGMTFSQIKRATSDASSHGVYDDSFSWRRLESSGRGRFVLVPSLAAIAPIGENQPTAFIEFYVSPYRAPLIPGLEVREPFRGKLGSSLSFKDRPVSKMAVENVFGSIGQVATNTAEALEFRKKGERFIQKRSDAVEEAWYPDKGITFVFESNVVTSFRVFRASETKLETNGTRIPDAGRE